MTWQFYGGTTDPVNRTPESQCVRHRDGAAQAVHDDGGIGVPAADREGEAQGGGRPRWSSNRRGMISAPGRLKR